MSKKEEFYNILEPILSKDNCNLKHDRYSHPMTYFWTFNCEHCNAWQGRNITCEWGNTIKCDKCNRQTRYGKETEVEK